MGAVAWRGGARGTGATMERRGCIPAEATALRGSHQAETAFPEDLKTQNESYNTDFNINHI